MALNRDRGLTARCVRAFAVVAATVTVSTGACGRDLTRPAAPVADLEISKSVDNAEPETGETVTFTVIVTNNGPATAPAVIAADTLPDGLTYESHTETSGIYSALLGVWTLGDLDSGSVDTLTLRAVVTATEGLVENLAGVISEESSDENPVNNVANAIISIGDPAPPSVDLQLTKDASDSTPGPNQTVAYTITVTNNGPVAATGVTAVDTLPTGLNYSSNTVTAGTFNETTLEWQIGTLGAGVSETLTLNATVTAASGTDLENIAGVTTANPDTVPGNDGDRVTVTVGTVVTPQIDLQLSKTVDNASPAPNGAVAFTISVTNNGPGDATGVVAGDTLPAGLDYTSHTESQGTFNNTTGVWQINSLAAGNTATLTVNASVSAAAGASITNSASVAADNADSNPGNNSDDAQLVVQTPIPPPAPGEPTYNVGVDELIHTDNFDAFATIQERFQNLVNLRNTQGVGTHETFISDNRSTEADPANHLIVTPGRGGTGRALRAAYTGAAQEVITWVTWPAGPPKYTPENATIAFTFFIRISPGWDPGSVGNKFMEMWHPSGSGRTQVSIVGSGDPSFILRWGSNPLGGAAAGDFGRQPDFARRWNEFNDGAWHRFTWLYQPAAALGDDTGVIRMWIDGSKIIDISALGVTEGYCTAADVTYLSNLSVRYLLFPDVQVGPPSGQGNLDHDDFTWWVELGTGN